MSPIQFLRILLARRWIVLITLVVCMVVAMGVAKTLPERYPARARVLLDLIKPDPVTGQSISGGFARGYVKTQIEIIQDFRVTGVVFDRLGWAQNPAVVAAWQAETGGVGDIRRWGGDKISQNTSANIVEGSNILEIIYESPNADDAKQIVSLIREAYIEASLQFKTDGASRTASWYRDQAEAARKVLTAAEVAKNSFERANGLVVSPGGNEAESTKLTALQQALVAAQSGESSQQFAATVQASTSPVVDQLKMQLATLNDQLELAAEKLGTQHPSYQSGLARRKLLEKQLATEKAAAAGAGAAQSGASRRSVADLQSQYEAQKSKVLGMKDTLDQLAALQREVDLRRSQYEKAAARTADLQLESNVSESGLVVLGDAVGGKERSFPIWSKIIGLAAAFGAALGIVVAVLTELYARRIRGPEDLRFASNVPVLAVIADRQSSPWRDRIRRLLTRGNSADAPLQPAQ
ncbi:MAG: exopolysaccharide biosynthesis protein EpsF [Sandarakinorhabdus sp.]|nr:exopolysaccharide biosynthesis protein EpsF [Sandarakinorhabdus sp.]